MKHPYLYTLLLPFAFFLSCGEESKPGNSTENGHAPSNRSGTAPGSIDPGIHTEYLYADPAGGRMIIQNGYPKGGTPYTDPKGEEYAYAVFWTRIINETANDLELKMDLSGSYEVPSVPGKYFQLVIPPDSMTPDKSSLFNYGLKDLDNFLDSHLHKPSILHKTIKPNDSVGFFVVKLNLRNEGPRGGGSILRIGLILKGQDLFYKVSVYNNTAPLSIVSEREIKCGTINLMGMKLQQ